MWAVMSLAALTGAPIDGYVRTSGRAPSFAHLCTFVRSALLGRDLHWWKATVFSGVVVLAGHDPPRPRAWLTRTRSLGKSMI
jgi:hypothetical protein